MLQVQTSREVHWNSQGGGVENLCSNLPSSSRQSMQCKHCCYSIYRITGDPFLRDIDGGHGGSFTMRTEDDEEIVEAEKQAGK